MKFKIFQCIELLGAGCLSDKWMKDLLQILEKNLNAHFENEILRFERRKDEDYDEVWTLKNITHYFILTFRYI